MSWTVDGNSYDNRKKITIQNANISADLSNFPVYVDITADTDIGGISNADGFDIRFTASDGTTLLKYERESFAIAAGSATGNFWVKTNVTTATATDIYIYYRTTDTADGADPANVWDANFVLVDHLNDLTTSTTTDSTATPSNGTKGSANNPIEATGIVNKAQDFSSDKLDWGAAAKLLALHSTQARSVSLWVNADTLADYLVAFTMDTGAGAGLMRFSMDTTANPNRHFWINMYNTSDAYTTVTGTTHPATGTWYHISGTYSGTIAKLYINGIQEGGDSASFSGKDTNLGYTEAGSYNNGAGAFWDGKIDEVRVSNSVRTVAWMNFEYHNMAEADNELTWGAQETPGAGAGPANLKTYNTNVASNIKSVNTNILSNIKSVNTNI